MSADIRPIGSRQAAGAADLIEAQWGSLPVVQDLRNGSVGRTAGETPFVMAAFEGPRMVGCAAILLDDLPGYAPSVKWFGCLVVMREYRGRGHARSLLHFATDRASEASVDRLLLFCAPSLEGFYAQEGWSRIEVTNDSEHEVVVMQVYPAQVSHAAR